MPAFRVCVGPQSFGFRGRKNGARPFRRTLLHEHDKAFAVARHTRHIKGRGPARPIAELINRADDIRVGDGAPGVFPALDQNRAGARNAECKNTRRAAAAFGDLDDKIAASLGQAHRHGQRAIEPLVAIIACSISARSPPAASAKPFTIACGV
jgi:hypothetical protein